MCVCVRKAPVPLCSVLDKVVKSWQTIRTAQQLLAHTARAVKRLFVRFSLLQKKKKKKLKKRIKTLPSLVSLPLLLTLCYHRSLMEENLWHVYESVGLSGLSDPPSCST